LRSDSAFLFFLEFLLVCILLVEESLVVKTKLGEVREDCFESLRVFIDELGSDTAEQGLGV
jgi:hypothetical protein